MKASVILPTRNRAYILKYCLQYLFNQSISDYEIIVIDDASTDNTQEIIKNYELRITNCKLEPDNYKQQEQDGRPDGSPLRNSTQLIENCSAKGGQNSKLKYIKLEQRMGPYVARNIGIKEAKGEVIIFVDSDVLVHRDFVKDHITVHEKYPDVILQGMVHHIKNVKKATFKNFYPNAVFFGLLVSQNTSVRKEWLLKAGLFDESLGAPLGFKDIELGVRLEKLGLNFRYGIRICKAYHIDLPYGNRRLKENIFKYCERGRSAYFFVKKHGEKAEKITHTRRILARAKFFNTEKWVKKPSCIKFLEDSIDSPIKPLFPIFRKLVKYHYYAKGIKEAELNYKK